MLNLTKLSPLKVFRTHFKSSNTRSGIDYGIYDHGVEGFNNIFSVLPGKFALHRLVAAEVIDNILTTSGLLKSTESNNQQLNAPVETPNKIIEYVL